MASGNDPLGYYAQLGVDFKATADEIKSAFRRLAKELHPDVNPEPAAKVRFQAVSAAYAVIGNEKLRARYDAGAATEQRTEARDRPINPICCSSCGNITAQPRPIVYYRVISFLLSAVRTPVKGIYCSLCARKTALRSSLITALAGWWSIPGFFWTIGAIASNAKGGTFSRKEEERLLWYNALAFTSQGTLTVAYGLMQRLRKADDNAISLKAFKLMQHLQAMGVPADTPPLKDPWRFRAGPAFAQIAMLAAMPALATGYILFDSASTSRSIASNTARQFSPGNIGQVTPRDAGQFLSGNSAQNAQFNATRPTPAAPKVTVPECETPPRSGQVLVRNMTTDDVGHSLEIKNGASGDAIIKIRNENSGALMLSFFVARGHSTQINGLPDGHYRFQYALGGALDASCKSFLKASGASQFPNPELLMTRRTSTQIIRSRLSYTLYTVQNGNVRPQQLNMSAFNAD